MDKENLFWDSSIDELKIGYVTDNQCNKCIICGKEYQKGRIYDIDSCLYDANKAIDIHLKQEHGSMLKYLLGMNNNFIGISESQKKLLVLIAQGLSDKDIATKLNVASSTIRNHRYKLREKEKQAKIFLALMDLIGNNTKRRVNMLENEILEDAHKTATTIDDRYNITDIERKKVIETYIDKDGKMKVYPSKEKKKIIILGEILTKFTREKRYSEKEVNNIIKNIYDDYATIRRALIEYGFMKRSDNCCEYWVNE